jgi:hypothetical protein
MTNQALLISHSTSDPEVLSKEHLRLSTRISNSSCSCSKHGLHIVYSCNSLLHKSQWFYGKPHPRLIVLR